jgi:hypothetical protein
LSSKPTKKRTSATTAKEEYMNKENKTEGEKPLFT